MIRGIVILLVLFTSAVSQGGLLENFAESYALYQQCTSEDADFDSDGDVDGRDFLQWQRGLGLALQNSNVNGDVVRDGNVNDLDLNGWVSEFGMTGGFSDAVCFKLYLEPEGIIDGQVTAFVDAPDPGPGQLRFNGMNGVIARHPGYATQVLNTSVLPLPGRQRFEAVIDFHALNPMDPPSGPITIFGYEIHDVLPQLGLNDVHVGFEFKGANHITTFNPDNGQITFFDESQLQDVPLPLQTPVLQTGNSILAIDIDPPTSNSSYPAGETPEHSLDRIATTKYLNFGKRNTGFIVVEPVPPQVVQSMVLTTANDFPNRDPASYELYGTTQPVLSPDNSDGQQEMWQLISAGPLNLPNARGVNGPVISFPNFQPYFSYRLVFPHIKNFRDANSMQIADVALFTSPDGSGPSIFSFMNDARAIQLPTLQADSPLAEGPENILDGDPLTKYVNFGRENAGFIVTPGMGPIMVTSFEITTANDSPGRDPASWALYGTNDPIVSGDFSQGTAEMWTLIGSGTLALPDARLTVGPVVAVNNTTAYQSYRMVFPTLKDPSAPGVDSVQFADIQFFAASGMTSLPAPEPGSILLLGWGTVALAWVSGTRRRRRR